MRAPGCSSLRSLGRSLSLNSGDRNSVTTLAPPKSVVKRSSVMNWMRSSTPARRAFSRLSAMRCGSMSTQAPRAPYRTTAAMTMRDMGSFHVGGRDVEISGRPVKEIVFTPGGVPAKVDPNGTYSVEAMYVQYFLPAERRGAVPLLMWHGGGLTGVTYETTPDGREGWLTYFVRHGWDVYNSDAVERGRAGWAMYPDIFRSEPVVLAKANPFERFRIGQSLGSYSSDPAKQRVMPGSQFPVAAYDNFVKQNVPRWTTTDDAILRAYIAEIDKVCPCALLFHSQAGQFGFRAAQARPDKVKALIAVEPAGIGDP